MAEFVRVVNAVKGMCDTYECVQCPMAGCPNGCMLVMLAEYGNPKELEQSVLEWLARKEERNG